MLRTIYPKVLTLTVALMLAFSAIMFTSAFSFTVSAQTAPSITIGNGSGYVNTTVVTLNNNATGAIQMRFSNENGVWSSWEPYSSTKSWTLTDGDGTKTVFAQFQDNANQTTTATATVILDTVPPVPDPYIEWVSIVQRSIYFDATYSTDDSPMTALWDFGDGNQTAGKELIHVYATIGNYSASLTVTDLAGNKAVSFFTVRIPNPNDIDTSTPTPMPTAHITFNPTLTPAISLQPSNEPNSVFSVAALLLLVGVVVIVVVLVVALVILNKRWKNPT